MEQAQVLTFLNNKDRDLLLQFCGTLQPNLFIVLDL